MSSAFDTFPTPLPPHQHHQHHPHHHHNVNAVPRSLIMPAPASQVHNFPSLSAQQQQQSQSSQPQSTQTTFAQTPQDPKKRHACPTCNRAFTTSGHLARHIRVHTGERNHKCPFPGCETRCSRQDNLQQHYRIHLSPGSRRSSSTRARGESKKKTSLSTSSTLPSLSPVASPRNVLVHDEPPDSPPPLARATVLPSLHHRSSYSNSSAMLSHERSDQTQSQNHNHNQGRSHSSASAPASASGSGSSAGSPRDGEYNPYNSPYTQTTTTTPASSGHVYPHQQQQQQQQHSSHRQLSTDSFAMSSNSSAYSDGTSQSGASFAHTLPPIQSLDSTHGTNGSGSFGLGRLSQQHPGPYPSYETYSATANSNGHTPSSWSAAQESSYGHHHTQHSHQSYHNAWWSQNNVNVGVSVGSGAQRGYHSYGAS